VANQGCGGVNIRTFLAVFAVLGPTVVTGPQLAAQNSDSVRSSYEISLPPNIEIARLSSISPGNSVGTPTAYGAQFGDVFFGAGFQARTRYSKDLPLNRRVDGDVYAGFGLGNPYTNLGFEFAATSYTTVRDGFMRGATFSFKIHRALPWNFAIAFGWEDAIRSGSLSGQLDAGSSMYGVITSEIPLRDDPESPMSSVTVSTGVGGGRFQNERAFSEGNHGVNAFGSVGIRVFRPLSVIADWTGQDLMLGASLVPFRRLPLFITAAAADVTGSAGDGARFVAGAGFDFNLLHR